MTIQPAIKGYVTRKQWGAASPKRTPVKMAPGALGVAVHHGASTTPTDHARCITTWRSYQRYHLNHPTENYSDIAYCAGFCTHGYVFEGRGWTTQGGANGTSKSNRTYYSLCFIGSGTKGFSTDAKAALLYALHLFRINGKAGRAVKPHRHFQQTTCPSEPIAAFIRDYDGKTISLSPPTPPAPQPPAPPPEDPMPLTKADLAAIRAIVRDELDSIETARSVWTRHRVVKDTRDGRDPEQRVTPSTLLEGEAS